MILLMVFIITSPKEEVTDYSNEKSGIFTVIGNRMSPLSQLRA